MSDRTIQDDPRLAEMMAKARLREAFIPHAPVNQLDVFRGRLKQIRDATDAVVSPGLHAVVYGDRGVGKTSLANILADVLHDSIAATSHVNCTISDGFASLAGRALSQIMMNADKQPIGFSSVPQEESYPLAQLLSDDPSPDEVAALLDSLGSRIVLIFDEFDRLLEQQAMPFADLIKSLSDRGSTVTVLIVGVSKDVNGLIASHESIIRCLRQIPMPAMSADEISEIVESGMAQCGMVFQNAGILDRIVRTAQGYPHYAHLICLHSGEAAASRGSRTISDRDLEAGLRMSVEYTDHQLREAYYDAVTGTRKENIWKEVVLACATAETDDRGFFSLRNVQDRLGKILGEEVSQQRVNANVVKLIEPERGPLLHRTGPERRYRYNFVNPLLRPFILMQAELAMLPGADGTLPFDKNE